MAYARVTSETPAEAQNMCFDCYVGLRDNPLFSLVISLFIATSYVTGRVLLRNKEVKYTLRTRPGRLANVCDTVNTREGFINTDGGPRHSC